MMILLSKLYVAQKRHFGSRVRQPQQHLVGSPPLCNLVPIQGVQGCREMLSRALSVHDDFVKVVNEVNAQTSQAHSTKLVSNGSLLGRERRKVAKMSFQEGGIYSHRMYRIV